jgi:predicted nucleotidyltransferase component of viral defense system
LGERVRQLDIFSDNLHLKLQVVRKKLGARSTKMALDDIVLTHVIEHFAEVGASEQLVFKGGSMLRRIHVGQSYRFSGDLDFTLNSASLIDIDGSIATLIDKVSGLANGISFHIPSDGIRIPIHGNTHILTLQCLFPDGEARLVKVEIDHRAEPILDPVLLSPKANFSIDTQREPLAVSCLALEEVLGEKVRASYQRIRVRDLYDLNALRNHEFDEEVVRKISVLKMWEAPLHNDPFTGNGFLRLIEKRSMMGEYESDKADLAPYLREKEKLAIPEIVSAVADRFKFLGSMSSLERRVAQDLQKANVRDYENLKEEVRDRILVRTTSLDGPKR